MIGSPYKIFELNLRNDSQHLIYKVARRIRIVTYNIHKCRGLDGRVQPARIVEVLRKIDADIIALQEVLSVPGKPERDQARFIATELGFNFCLGENRRLHGGAYGNLLLSRFPMRDSENHDITTEKREQRGCLRTDIDLTETTLHVFNVHLGTSFLERRQQARKLVGPEILQNPELHGPRIVLGDFNDWTHGLSFAAALRSFQERGYPDAAASFSYVSWVTPFSPPRSHVFRLRAEDRALETL